MTGSTPLLSTALEAALANIDTVFNGMRRLLPQGVRAMAEGVLEGVGWGDHGLSQVDWRSWPAEQATAVEEFVHAWWQDVHATPKPPYQVEEVFEICAAIGRSVTPLLDRRPAHPVADAHLVRCVDWWLDRLLVDDAPFTWFPHGAKAAVPGLQSWPARNAPARLRAQGEPDLAIRAGLLGLPYDDRWAHPYWADPSTTN
ncbi:hypothetical protein BEK98_13340 [Streptomyces diastatochromogenes]|uniref:Uncharacterized protein n=1 Tax=Streptomyces diastatochromogenes TaxID=42236 RepID=A0A233SL15_STRDA|nr:hypothetical protein BEK98_13340 [Streptomyces diastatochromogenes]